MNDAENTVRLDLVPHLHTHFMRCIKAMHMTVTIDQGDYVVTFKELKDVYTLGIMVANAPNSDFLSGYGLRPNL